MLLANGTMAVMMSAKVNKHLESRWKRLLQQESSKVVKWHTVEI
jgi:hypothetical protein